MLKKLTFSLLLLCILAFTVLPCCAAEAPITLMEAMNFFNQISGRYRLSILNSTDPQTEFYRGINPYDYFYFTEPVFEGTGVEMPTQYLSIYERQRLDPQSYYSVYSVYDMQNALDTLWGKGRIWVADWPGGGGTDVTKLSLHSDNHYLFILSGFGDDGLRNFFEPVDFSLEGDKAIITTYCLQSDYYGGAVSDCSYDQPVTLTYNPAPGYESSEDFASLLEKSGQSRSSLGIRKFTFFREDGQLRLFNSTQQ